MAKKVLSICCMMFVVMELNAHENELFKMIVGKDKTITLKHKPTGSSIKIVPEFTILYREDDPAFMDEGAKSFYKEQGEMRIPAWNHVDTPGKRTANIYETGQIQVSAIEKIEEHTNEVHLIFQKSSNYSLRATIALPRGQAFPRVSYTFVPVRNGYYAVGFTGMPVTSQKNVNSLFQPFIWQDRRFPHEGQLSTENMCTMPAVIKQVKNITTGIVIDPNEIPFRLPSIEMGEIKFGLAIKNQTGGIQPIIFSPVLGTSESLMEGDQAYSFGFYIVVHGQNIHETTQYLAENVLNFTDYRQNLFGSLNEVLENMVQYAMNDKFSGWEPDLRGFDYSTDVKRSAKVVSSLHPLSISIILDDEQVFSRRALPMIEYMMSRERFLFSVYKDVGGQNVSSKMKGPAPEVSELAELYHYSGKRTPVFMHYATQLMDTVRILNLFKKSPGDAWYNLLTMYNVTGNKAYLQKAEEKANYYIRQNGYGTQTTVDFSEDSYFWTDVSPLWMELTKLYEATGNELYLEEAKKGAMQYIQYIWFSPAVPADSSISLNQGGIVPYRSYEGVRENMPFMEAPPQDVPAWVISQIGLTPEACNTYQVNPAIFLTNYAPHLLRLAYYTNNDFLKMVARAAVIGRYSNYPGYDINGIFNIVYARPDYPLRPLDEISYNQVYYNHVWPQMAMIMDYLVTDAIMLSNKNIQFPSLFSHGYAYLKSNVFGSGQGSFYDEDSVYLWMPQKMLKTSNEQVNYIAGYSQDKLLLAFTNQSDMAFDFEMALNPLLVPFNPNKDYKMKVWEQNTPAGTKTLENGKVNLSIAPKGITAVAIEGLKVRTQFQGKIYSRTDTMGNESFQMIKSPIGNISTMLMSFGEGLTSLYVWLEAEQEIVSSTNLLVKTGSEKEQKKYIDSMYPYEFSIPTNEDEIEFIIECVGNKGDVVYTKRVVLRK